MVRYDADMLDLETLSIRIDGSVLYAAFNNPPLNIVTSKVVADLIALFDHVDQNRAVRVVVFSSLVPGFYLAHQDYVEPERGFDHLLSRVAQMDVITIAQVEGRARSIGANFALACDMAFAADESAIFGQLDVGLGILPTPDAIERLHAGLGRQRTLEVMLGCNDFCASDAERYGWINRAMPAGELEPFVCALAQRLASFPQTSIRETKRRYRYLTRAIAENAAADKAETMRGDETVKRLALLNQRGLGYPGELESDFGRILAELPPATE
jgi:enoyl-CoA hydratase/carnithine racemase